MQVLYGGNEVLELHTAESVLRGAAVLDSAQEHHAVGVAAVGTDRQSDCIDHSAAADAPN